MDWGLLLAYVLTVLLVVLPIATIPISLLGRFLFRLMGTHLLWAALSGSVVWFLVDVVWVKTVGRHIPVLCFGLCLAVLLWQRSANKDALTVHAKRMLQGEIFGMLSVATYTLIVSDQIRWY